jgi:Flp pilus assembly protein TadD
MAATVGTVLLMVATAAFLRAGMQKKYLTTGWLWYLITLVPVIGIVQVGDQAHADRYTYVPFIGIFIMISWGVTTIADRLHNSKKFFVKIAAAALFLAMIGTTWKQVGYWKNGVTLFSHAVAVTKRNYVAYDKIGFLMDQSGCTDEAMANYRRALAINPNDGEAHNNLGILLARFGRSDEAMAHFQMVLQLNPNDGEAHNNLGLLLVKLGRIDEAIAHYRKSLEVNPDKIGTLPNLAFALVQKGQLTDAIPLLQRALALAKSDGDEAQAKTMTEILEKLFEASHSSPRAMEKLY